MNDSTQADDWVFAGRYRVDAPIGSGGMGAVWSGYDTQLDRRVAIKLMHQASPAAFLAGSPEAESLAQAAATDRERFLREIRTTARLEHPGIPAVYDFGVEDATGRIFLVMQLLYGQTLADLIASRDYGFESWPISWAAAIGAQVAATLVDVHRVDVVHRDLKPTNIMVTSSGLVKILDFGVAVLQGASTLPKLTQIGRTVGSPPYMSREQALGNPVGPATDVYALGCVLHEMATGRVPFHETPAHSFQDHHVNTPPTSMKSLRPDVPAALDDLVLSMLAKQPTERPDAEVVYEALVPLVNSDRSAATDASPVERDPRRPFLRPLAPAPRSMRPAAAPRPAVPPLDFDEMLQVHDRAAELIRGSLLQQAIDLLDDAVFRSAGNAGIALEMKIELATTLFAADEFSRAAKVLDEIMPSVAHRAEASLLRYYAGVSHAEIGELDAAINNLRAFLADAEPADPLYRDAKYQLGMMLPAIGQTDTGVQELEELRPLLIAEYGEHSIHVRTLDRRIAQLRETLAD